jgi:hypothetical protein
MNNFQRNGAASNTQVGDEFEKEALVFLNAQVIGLQRQFRLNIGIEGKKKQHKFDFGSEDPKVIVECKSHTWTESDRVPVAKMKAWTEAMYCFYAAPRDYRKIFFVLKNFSKKHNKTLARYYLKAYDHLIPSEVEFWEYDPDSKTAEKLEREI